MLETIVKVMFGGSCLLLAAVFLRRDLFLTPELEHFPRIKPITNNHNTMKLTNVATCEDNLRAGLERSVSQWDPILIRFLVNERGVNVALASTDDLYLQLKALEFCTENAAVFQLQSLEQLESECAIPVLSVFRSKLQNGDYWRPVARNVPVADAAPEFAADTSVSSTASDSTSNEAVDVSSNLDTRKDESEVEIVENKGNEFVFNGNIPEHVLAAEVAVDQQASDLFIESTNIAGDNDRNTPVVSNEQKSSLDFTSALLEEEFKLNVETIEKTHMSIPENKSSEFKIDEEIAVFDVKEATNVFETVEEKL